MRKITSGAQDFANAYKAKVKSKTGVTVTATPRDPRGGIYDPNYGQGKTVLTVPGNTSNSGKGIIIF